jgi:ankyrin repeat protein
MSGLIDAAIKGDLAKVQRLLREGASITEVDRLGRTALLCAAYTGHLAVVRWLIKEGGASITEAASGGMSALIMAGMEGHCTLAQWLLEKGGASIDEGTSHGITVWSFLYLHGAADAEQSSLLKVMVLLTDAPPDSMAQLSPQHAELATRGRQLRALLPSYLEQQWALLTAHCPLPAVLFPLVAAYAAPTPEDMWTDWVEWM